MGAATLAVVIIAGAAVGVWEFRKSSPPPPGCAVTVDSATYDLDLEQAQNAATITAVGNRIGLPDHAVTVALAAALQESKLRNLPYGDRDSVGLFQQRPSQGWGARERLLDPSYAANAFYVQLAKVPGWRTMPVAAAAQRVQRSAAGSAYVQWENEARTLARALTGETAAALSCRFSKPRLPASTSFAADVASQLGPRVLDVSLPRNRGWAVANWMVANAYRQGIQAVTFDGMRWTNSTGTWRADSTTTRVVRVRRFGP